MHFQTRALPDNLDLTQLCHDQPDHYPYALVSTVTECGANSRYHIFFAYPQQLLALDQNNTLRNQTGLEFKENSGFLDSLDSWWKSTFKTKPNPLYTDLPFTGGWFVYLSYELATEIEPCLQSHTAKNNIPVNSIPIALAVRCPAAIIVDRLENKIFAIAENEYVHLLDMIESDCNELIHNNYDNADQNNNKHSSILTTSVVEADAEPYLKQVTRIKQYIRDGDIFQANLSRLWRVDIKSNVEDVDIFRYLSKSNPGSFAALIKTENATIISSSPERLVKAKNNRVETRPIAGTRPRSSKGKTDELLAKELLAHPKEQAEHIMLIDLERNDLGRICIPGSIEVNELMTLESYQHVHHIVSNVQGQIRDNVTPTDIIRAVFPGGTITGCPKVRCMEILADMEAEPRGAYTGSAGYINLDGSLDLNILIRTMVREGNTINFRAGGGIVADSDPQHELDETRAKAKGLLRVFDKQAEPCKA